MFFAANPKDNQSRAMHKLELPVIGLDIRLLTLIFAGFYFKVGAAVAVIASPATEGWATVFWIGVVGIGFGISILKSWLFLLRPAVSQELLLFDILSSMPGRGISHNILFFLVNYKKG